MTPYSSSSLPTWEDIEKRHPDWLDEALNTRAVSRLTGVPVTTLTTWRSRGGGPKFLKYGKSVRYRRRVVLQWMADCEAPYVDREGIIHPPGQTNQND